MARSSSHYRLFVGMLWSYTSQVSPNGLTEALEEPALGNPIPLRLGGRCGNSGRSAVRRGRLPLIRASPTMSCTAAAARALAVSGVG